MKIAIITDGNNQLGLGHVYQSMTLGNYLKEKMNLSDEIVYITKSAENVIQLLETTKCIVLHCLNDDLILDNLKELKPDRIVFDKLDVAPVLAKKIKCELEARLIICTNLTEANLYADVTVMAGMGSDFKNIYKSENGKTTFWGPKYWIIRPEFFHYLSKPIKKSNKICNILLQFGGTDQANLTSKVLEKILLIDNSFEITIVIGSAFEFENILKEIIVNNQNTKIKIKVFKNSTKIAEIMANSDLSIVSPGLSFFESLVVGTPVLCFHQNEFQKNAWERNIETLGTNDVNRIPEILKLRKFIFPTDDFIQNMEIGKGVDAILNEILK